MKITIEIDHKTTKSDVEKLIGALQSVYTIPEPKEEKKNIQIHKEQIDPNLERINFLFSERQYRDVESVYKDMKIPRSKAWIYHLVRGKKISSRIENKKVYVSQKEIEDYFYQGKDHK